MCESVLLSLLEVSGIGGSLASAIMQPDTVLV
jgi:hypothetical protein